MTRPVKATEPRSIPERPLICTPGLRPKGVSLDPYRHGAACSIDDAKKYYSEFVSRLDSASCYRGDVDTCFEKKRTIPSMFFRYGVGRVSHPFIERIAYSLDLPALEDFRSSEVFDAVARTPEIAELVQMKRKITMLYPGSGSHLSPLLIPLRLIDVGRIDSANVIYTDIDQGSCATVEQYLRYLSAPGRDVIRDFQMIERSVRGPGSVTEFRFIYGGKPVSLFFSVGRKKEEAERYWAPRDYYEMADLVILHDGPEGSERKGILKHLEELSEQPNAKRRLVLSDNPAFCDPEKNSCQFDGIQISYRFFEGHYGCSYDQITKVARYGMDASGRLVMRGFAEKVHALDDEVFGRLYDVREAGGLLIDFSPKDQKSKPPISIRMPRQNVVLDFANRL